MQASIRNISNSCKLDFDLIKIFSDIFVFARRCYGLGKIF